MKITTALGELCEINPRLSHRLSPDTDCSFVPMDCVDDIAGQITRKYARRIAEVQKGYTPFENGDVLFAKITPCMENGKCAIAANLRNGIGYGSTEFHVIRAGTHIIPEWIYYYLRQEKTRQQAERRMTGSAGQKRVPAAFLEELPIPLLSLSEQKRIAALLDKADRLRRTRRYARQLSDTFLQSVFLQMFGDPVTNPMGWDVVEVGEVFDIQLGKMLDAKRITGQSSYPYLGNSNVQWGRLDLKEIKRMDFEDDFEKYRLMKGDILVCEGGEVGRTAIWNGEIADCCYQKALHRLRPKDDRVEPLFMLMYMRLAVIKGHIAKQTFTATIAHFTAERFNQLKMILPTKERQQKFAQVVRRVERLRDQQTEAERQAEHLFQTLLHRAFRGELSSEPSANAANVAAPEEIQTCLAL